MDPLYLLIPFAYLLGSISAAIIICKLMGLPDPRTLGSNNPGATNVLRIGGKKAAALTLLGDFLKGLIPVLVAQLLGADSELLAAVGFAAFLGHLYPLFFGFRGGKGVATAFGVILALSWMVALVAIGIWLLIAKVFKISSLAALIAATMTPAAGWYLGMAESQIYMLVVLTLMLIWRHRSNIQKLMRGSEGQIGSD
ncbi:MAG: glycerol-3-phosphate 1-O-acyltransferase PlsY [Gammaproteobacteria bacterium]|nr:glycerol-3-phosphate 1-O-acyltransferase PlsY [Gammaproteobacteria bacterium]